MPLLLRRTRPELAAALLIPAHVAQLIVLDQPVLGNVTVPLMMFAVAAHSRRRWKNAWLVFAIVCALAAAFDWSLDPRSGHTGLDVVALAVTWGTMVAVISAAWVMGLLSLERVRSVEALHDRAAALERERDQSTRLARAEERSQIAREMHDVVAHSLSVIVVQADGAEYATAQADDQQGLATARAALNTIGTIARGALDETRRLVGVLRSDDDMADRHPRRTLEEIPELVARVRNAGVAADFQSIGDPAAHPVLGAGTEMSAYRIVQEALTNVMKHAGEGASVEVVLTHTQTGIELAVRDDGAGSHPTDQPGRPAGHGLIGMRERVTAYGGSLVTRDRLAGGFEIVASFPALPDGQDRGALPAEAQR